LATEAPDLEVFVYLEEVDGNGNSTYITEGELRASHRNLSQAPFDNFGLPWRNHFQNELQSILRMSNCPLFNICKAHATQ